MLRIVAEAASFGLNESQRDLNVASWIKWQAGSLPHEA
jgi:hypothetical protein